MKLEAILEEMGILGMSKIKNKLNSLIKKYNIKGKWDIKQDGSIYSIFKDGKLYAKVPYLRIMNDDYLISILQKEKV
jgi:hypothetical protein